MPYRTVPYHTVPYRSRSERTRLTEERELVLEALPHGKVALIRQNRADSSHSQLWKVTLDGCLENIGFSHRRTANRRPPMVLDVLYSEGTSHSLMMKERDVMRDNFQIWTFTDDGRLCCQLPEMYVQATSGFDPELAPTGRRQPSGMDIPSGQQWIRQAQRPGSGMLNVECFHEGPTHVLRITDNAEKCHPPRNVGTAFKTDSQSQLDVELNVRMDAGVGLSLINGSFEELLYCRMEGIVLFSKMEAGTYSLTGQIMAIQVDNQLLTAEHWPVLYCKPKYSDGDSTGGRMDVIPALKLETQWTPKQHYDAVECFRLQLLKMTVLLDETLLWKLVHFVRHCGVETADHTSPWDQPPNTSLFDLPDPLLARRCYLGTLQLICDQLHLSVSAVSGNSLPVELLVLKQQFPLKLISFDGASIQLRPFRQTHAFETLPFLLETVHKHFREELEAQALRILGTVDFLGNPFGLAGDVADGLQGFVMDGSVTGLVGGIGYGVSNSISKLASSAAGALTIDESHEHQRRKALRYRPTSGESTALGHLYTGIKGLGVGVVGGVTSIFTGTIEGTKTQGMSGALVGMGAGAVGVVTKPVQGLLDLAAGTASAVKDVVGESRSSSRKPFFPEHRVRLPRVAGTLGGYLCRYSSELAAAQQQLLRINEFNTDETCLSVVPCSSALNMRHYALICTKRVYFVRNIDDEPSIVTQIVTYKHLKQATPVRTANGRCYLALIVESKPGRLEKVPNIFCSKMEHAQQLCDNILRAKLLLDHSKRTLTVPEDISFDLV